MISDVAICNQALIMNACDPIQSLTASSKEAQTCNAIFEYQRDFVLRAHTWSFAERRRELALSTDTVSGWSYVYTHPADCLFARYIWNPLEGALAGLVDTDVDVPSLKKKKIPFKIVADDTLSKRYIVTNQDDAILVYTARVTNPVLFDSGFVEALKLKLAAELAIALKKSENMRRARLQEYQVFMSATTAVDASESNEDIDTSSDFERARQ